MASVPAITAAKTFRPRCGAVVGADTVGEHTAPACRRGQNHFAHAVGSFEEAVVGADTVGEQTASAYRPHPKPFAHGVGAYKDCVVGADIVGEPTASAYARSQNPSPTVWALRAAVVGADTVGEHASSAYHRGQKTAHGVGGRIPLQAPTLSANNALHASQNYPGLHS